MAVPDFQTLMLPILRLAATGEIKSSSAIVAMADQFSLSDEERKELLPSGRQSKIANRVHWAVTHLAKAGLLNRPRRGHFALSPQGGKVLASNPERIDLNFLNQFAEFREFRAGGSGEEQAQTETDQIILSILRETPDERIENAYRDLNSTLQSELLDRVLGLSFESFEHLIIDLMLAMGYGADGSGKHLGKTNDGGVDGIITEDILGLDVIYLQAKRYKDGNTIGVEKIREFAGVLDERRVTKGVFVTTSHFAPKAKDYAASSPKRLILIDGKELASLMVRYNVGVRSARTIEIKRIDAEYFDDTEI